MTRRLALPLALTLALVAAACGGSGSDGDADAIASLSEDAAPAGEDALAAESDETPEEELSFEDAQLEFATCMRETYPEWPDPDPDVGRGRLGFAPDQLDDLGVDFRDPEFQTALEDCGEVFQGVVGAIGELTPEEQAELEDNLLALFACVRETPGFEDIPDPDFGGTGPGFGLREIFESGEIDPRDFRDAMQSCAGELGLEGGPGGGGFRGPGGGGPRPADADGGDAA